MYLDIYRYQTVTNWNSVKAHGVRGIWVKLTDGNGPAIARGDGQVNGSKSVGIPVGGYHFAQPGNPEHQADVFTAELRRLGALGMPAALDLEAPFTPNAVARDFGIRFLKRMRANGITWLAVYMNNSFAKALRPQDWGIPNLTLWIARYGARPSVPYHVHQHSESGRVPGISGSVDLNDGNVVNGSTPAPPKKEIEEVAFTDVPLVAGPGVKRKTVNLPPWNKVKEVYIAVSSGWTPVNKLTLHIYMGRNKEGNKAYGSPSWCNYVGKPTLNVSLDSDDVIRYGIPVGAQAFSIEYEVSDPNGSPSLTVFVKE